ncbi:MAG: CotH kinase family protein [Bacillota bacterium]|nr:CotH kinase family protein [Bacillota bacterium]
MKILVCLVAFIAIGSVYDTAYAISDNLFFKEDFAVPGKTLTVDLKDDSEGISFSWYVDDEKVDEKSNTYTVQEADVEKFIRVDVTKSGVDLGSASMFCSDLPVIYINTDNGAQIASREEYVLADLKIQGNKEYSNSTLYVGRTEIRGRGNSTWTRFPKKPYKIKLDKSTDLFGMGKNKHWNLIANYIDESLMRNALATDLGKNLGTVAMDAVWTDVVLNGEYIGNYQLYEAIRVSKDRVNVFDWEDAAGEIAKSIAKKEGFSDENKNKLKIQMEEEDLSWISTGTVKFGGKDYNVGDYYKDLPGSYNGGWLFEMSIDFDEISQFKTSRGSPIMIKRPEYLKNDANGSFKAAQEFMQNYEDALYSPDLCINMDNKKTSYADLSDVHSMVSYWMACEILEGEIDFKGIYMHKDIDEALKFGPVWDFDFSSDSVAPFGARSPKKWITKFEGHWINQAMKDPYFAMKARELYHNNDDYFKNLTSSRGTLSGWHEKLKNAGVKNSEYWHYSRGFEEDYDTLLAWLNTRMSWMDKQFATVASTEKSLGVTTNNAIKLSLDAEDIKVESDKEYSISAGEDMSLALNIDVENGGSRKLNYYINGHYIGEVQLEANKAIVQIPREALTEEIGSENVIVVRLADDLSQMQYVMVELNPEGTNYNTVKFNDEGLSYIKVVKAGKKIIVEDSRVSNDKNFFIGWRDEETDVQYEAGDRISVNCNMTLRAEWARCNGDALEHAFKEDGDELVCSKCGSCKPLEKDLIHMGACYFTQSSRYNTKYTGHPVAPTITIYYGDRVLEKDKDYTIEIVNNVNTGYATYTVEGIDSAGFEGLVTLSYRIIPRDISAVSLTEKSAAYPLKKSEARPSFVYKGIKLIEGKDYTIECSNNTKLGSKATATINGIGNFSGTKTVEYRVIPCNVKLTAKRGSDSSIKLSWNKISGASGYAVYYKKSSSKKFTSLGKTTKNAYLKKKLKSNVKYDFKVVTYVKSNNKTYYSTGAVTTSVILKATKIKSVKLKNKKAIVKWKKVSGASGYEISRSSSKKTTKVVKSVSSKSTSVTLSGTKKAYYKVRAYKTINKVKVYGPWSKVICK